MERRTSKLRAVLCDLGGVIVLYDEKEIGRKLLAASRPDAAGRSELSRFLELKQEFDRGGMSPVQFYEKTRRLLGLDVSYEEFVPLWCDNFTLNHEVVRALEQLRRDFRLVLVSNTDVLHWEFLDRKFGIGSLFDGLVLSYRVGSVKPEPEIYEAALESAGVTPEHAVFIDDQRNNVEAARKLGIRGFVYEPGVDVLSRVREIFDREESGSERVRPTVETAKSTKSLSGRGGRE